MAGIDKLFSLAQSQGLTIPEVVKFIASPQGYMLSKVLDAIEYKTQLPTGTLGVLQNPSGAATNYVQTQASNALFDDNKPSKIETIINQLQDSSAKPNFVGPQEENSSVSSKNLADLLATLNQNTDTQVNNANSFVDTTPANTVGPIAQTNTDNNSNAGDVTDFISMLQQYQQPATPATNDSSSQNAPVIDFAGTMDYSDVFGDRDISNGGGGKFEAYAKGGRACSCHK